MRTFEIVYCSEWNCQKAVGLVYCLKWNGLMKDGVLYCLKWNCFRILCNISQNHRQAKLQVFESYECHYALSKISSTPPSQVIGLFSQSYHSSKNPNPGPDKANQRHKTKKHKYIIKNWLNGVSHYPPPVKNQNSSHNSNLCLAKVEKKLNHKKYLKRLNLNPPSPPPKIY